MKTFLLAALTMLFSMSCNGNNSGETSKAETAAAPETAAAKGKALIIYFSHAGENYSVGNIEVGNTKIVADYISEITGAEQFEIVCQKDYDMPYDKLIEVAKAEADNGELPGYKGDVKNLGDYDTVFIGGPIWWGTFPQVMFTFFRDHDLNGKTIIPFTTHEGSGLGSTVKDLKKAYQKAKYLEAFSMYGHDVRKGRDRVEKWLKRIGF